MGTAALEVADIFRTHGPAWRQAQRSHLSLGQLKVMTAIEQCRSAALGGHVLRCEDCQRLQVAYNSCRNRHCPKCQASAAQRWLDARQADLLPVDYFHVVFTLPAPISEIAYWNKAVVYGLLFEVAAQTLRTIAADPGTWVRRSVPPWCCTPGGQFKHGAVQEVVHGRDAAHGRPVVQSGVWPMPVVAVQEGLQGGLALR